MADPLSLKGLSASEQAGCSPSSISPHPVYWELC
jgi:hypothetical protein